MIEQSTPYWTPTPHPGPWNNKPCPVPVTTVSSGTSLRCRSGSAAAFWHSLAQQATNSLDTFSCGHTLPILGTLWNTEIGDGKFHQGSSLCSVLEPVVSRLCFCCSRTWDPSRELHSTFDCKWFRRSITLTVFKSCIKSSSRSSIL